MTHVEFMEKVKRVSNQYQDGAIFAAEGYNALVTAACEVSSSLYPEGVVPELESGEILTFDEQGNRIVINML